MAVGEAGAPGRAKRPRAGEQSTVKDSHPPISNARSMSPTKERKDPNMDTLQELLVEELQDLLHAENQLVKALPKMAKAANDEDLRGAFQEHLEQTKSHVERLTEAFDLLGEKAKGKPCKGMAGLIQEGQEIITEGKEKDDIPADLALIAAAQKVEHYEIAAYGSVLAIAERMERKDIVKLLEKTLQEEEKTDQLLTELASPLLERAEQMGEEELAEEA